MPPPKPKKTQKPRQPKRNTTKVPQPSGHTDNAADEVVHIEGVTVWVISSFDDKALDKEDTSKQGRIDEIDVDEDIALVSTHDDELQDEGMEDVYEQKVVEVVTTAKMLVDIVVDAVQVATAIADVSATKTIVTTALTITVDSTKTNVEEKVDVDYQLAERLQAEEQEQLTDAEKAKLFMKFMEKRRKFFAVKRTIEKRNKQPTKAQQRSIMSTSLKNMDGWKPRALKNKSFTEINELFDKEMKRINNFIDFRTELVEVSIEKMRQRQYKKAIQREQEMNLTKKDLRSKRWRMIKSLKSSRNVWKSFQMMEMKWPLVLHLYLLSL
uniref:Uncharacterized protein n=1 Tax=Tanacetum cinerariifolium TaxID=118510 RepID=A0A6L2N0T9_TANCI|nr:hypothetical protein [Tanacetum cinerariifolium]